MTQSKQPAGGWRNSSACFCKFLVCHLKIYQKKFGLVKNCIYLWCLFCLFFIIGPTQRFYISGGFFYFLSFRLNFLSISFHCCNFFYRIKYIKTLVLFVFHNWSPSKYFIVLDGFFYLYLLLHKFNYRLTIFVFIRAY